MGTALTLVSCVMPTFDRRRFVPEAIENFRLQTYRERELVIVDDGTDPVDDLVPDDPRIRYVRLEGRLSTGAKRNAACEAAAGEIIVHWDDDDWSAPGRVEAQVAALTGDVDVCGLRDLLFYDPTSDRGWLYRYPPRLRPWVAGGTMCYRRSLWERHRFPDVRQGEDTQFVWSQRRLRIAPIEGRDLYVAMIHGSNTAAKRTSGRRWSTVPGADVRAVLGPAAARYCRPTLVSTRDRPSPTRKEGVPAVVRPADAVPLVTVSIPHAGAGDHLRQAVESVLAQTHTDLRCVVVLDGDRRGLDALVGLDDPRLVRFEVASNHGRYFADQVVLDATDSPFLVVQDSDDWSAPDRIEKLLAQLDSTGADACMSWAVHHDRRRGAERSTTVSWPRLRDPVGSRLVHRAGHQGIYRTEALRRIGGFYGGHRIGFDTSLLNLLLLAGSQIACVDAPLYHRRIWNGSLSTSTSTGWGTAERRRVVEELSDLHRRAHRAASAAATPAEAAAAVAALVEGGWSDADRRTLASESAALRGVLAGDAPDVRPGPSAAASARRWPTLDEVLDLHGGRNDGWAISRLGATELYHRLMQRRPDRVLDVGSGLSTAVAAAAVGPHGGRVVSLEHDANHADRTRRLLDDAGLGEVVEVRVARLVERRHRAGAGPWYEGEPHGTFGFFVVDGPPLGSGGRIATFPELVRRRRGDWEFWLFDADRPDEASCLEQWRRCHRFRSSVEPIDATGVAVIRPVTDHAAAAPAPAVAGLGISILAGGRPALLQRTLDGVERRWPGQVERAHVVALLNGPDEASHSILRQRAWIDRVVRYEQGVLTIGMATSFVVGGVAAHPSVRAVLHLEDDWEVVTLDDGALATAMEAIRDETVGQVRLRHRTETVLDRHMITRRPIEWSTGERTRRARAHFTFNPAIVRADVADRVFPAVDEQDAQRRFLATGLDVVQVDPGVFRHTGERESRRAALRRQR